jgi:serine phosphatase RsbU (regulator of sigma subunit)
MKLSDSKVGICIADVVGKSVSAALLMANVQASVRAFASGSASPSWLCSRVNYEDSSVQLFSGDRLLLYTDGITEAARGDGEEFGEDRLISATKSMVTEKPCALQAHLLSDVKRFCDSQLQDDATLLVIAAQSCEANSLPEC